MSAQSAALAGQAAARRLMTDTVSLRAPAGAPVWNETTHRTEAATSTPFATSVPARIKALTGSDPVTADDTVRVTGYVVSLPWDADGVSQVVDNGEQNTLLDVTASLDPLLVGRTLRVVGVPRGTYLTARRLLCTLND